MLTMVLLSAIFPTSTSINDANSTIAQNQQNATNTFLDWLGKEGTGESLLGAIFVAVIVAILTPILREFYKVREEYLIPYSRWCISFSGAIHEFRELCFYTIKPLYESWNQPCAFADSSDIITHIWHTHEQVEEGLRWLSMFKKQNGDTVGDILDNVMDEVDTLWHKLEVYDSNLLGKRRNGAEFGLILKRMSVFERTSLVYFIVQEIGPELAEKKTNIQENAQLSPDCVVDPNPRDDGNLTETKFEAINDALNKRIPG